MTLTPPSPPPDPHVWRQPEFQRGRQYKIETDFAPLFAGEMALPNFERIEHWQALRASMGYGNTVERFKPAGKTFDIRVKARLANGILDDAVYYKDKRGSVGDAIYHLNCGQGGGLTGEGVVVIDLSGLVQYRAIPESIVAGRFTFCKHEKVEGAGANHQRGWHPGHCGKCGLDMSVDSGD